jgi:membrane protein
LVVKRLLERLKNSWPGRLATAYGQSKAGGYAAGLAFNGFMTMFPLMLGLLSIVGLVVHDPSTQERLENVITGIFPADAHQQLTQAIQGVKHNAGLLGVISIAGLVWGGTGFFGSMEFALTQMFGTRQRDIFRQKLMGVVMMLVFLAALLLTAGANSLAGIPFAVGQVVGPVVGALVLIVLLIAVYRFVPNRSFRLSEIWPGAVFAGILIEVVSLVFPIYARIAHGFNTYGQQFALFFLLATWLYLLSQLLLLGAVLNRMRLGPPREEGMVAQPGDRGEIPPPPAEAIDEQREQAGSRPTAPVSNRRERSSGPGQDQRHRYTDQQPAGHGEPRQGRAAAHGESPRGRLKQALFGVLGAAIGLLALARAPRARPRGPG